MCINIDTGFQKILQICYVMKALLNYKMICYVLLFYFYINVFCYVTVAYCASQVPGSVVIQKYCDGLYCFTTYYLCQIPIFANFK